MDSYNIDRDMLISHLYDVRALELTKRKISNDIDQNIHKINSLGYSVALYKPATFSKIIISFFCSSFVCAMLFFVAGATVFRDSITKTVYTPIMDSYDGFYLSSHMDYSGMTYVVPKNPEFGRYVATAIIITVVLVVLVVTITAVSAFKKLAKYKKMQSKDNERVANEQSIKEQLIAKNEKYIENLSELNSILNENYSVNIIPQQFRNLGGICYLYDYLSSSQESFQSALMNYNMNKINMNIQKIAAAQSDMLIQQYITNANLKDIKRQSMAMIDKLRNIEQNTENAAVYSAMNEANTRTIAFFKTYDFLKNG